MSYKPVLDYFGRDLVTAAKSLREIHLAGVMLMALPPEHLPHGVVLSKKSAQDEETCLTTFHNLEVLSLDVHGALHGYIGQAAWLLSAECPISIRQIKQLTISFHIFDESRTTVPILNAARNTVRDLHIRNIRDNAHSFDHNMVVTISALRSLRCLRLDYEIYAPFDPNILLQSLRSVFSNIQPIQPLNSIVLVLLGTKTSKDHLTHPFKADSVVPINLPREMWAELDDIFTAPNLPFLTTIEVQFSPVVTPSTPQDLLPVFCARGKVRINIGTASFASG